MSHASSFPKDLMGKDEADSMKEFAKSGKGTLKKILQITVTALGKVVGALNHNFEELKEGLNDQNRRLDLVTMLVKKEVERGDDVDEEVKEIGSMKGFYESLILTLVDKKVVTIKDIVHTSAKMGMLRGSEESATRGLQEMFDRKLSRGSRKGKSDDTPIENLPYIR